MEMYILRRSFNKHALMDFWKYLIDKSNIVSTNGFALPFHHPVFLLCDHPLILFIASLACF